MRHQILLYVLSSACTIFHIISRMNWNYIIINSILLFFSCLNLEIYRNKLKLVWLMIIYIMSNPVKCIFIHEKDIYLIIMNEILFILIFIRILYLIRKSRDFVKIILSSFVGSFLIRVFSSPELFQISSCIGDIRMVYMVYLDFAPQKINKCKGD